MASDYIATMTHPGKLPSMKNQRRIVFNRRTGKPMSIKSREAIDYEEQFIAAVPQKYRMEYAGIVSLKCRVWYPSRRNDLDIEFLCDLLQKSKIISNDRNIRHKECWAGIDKDNPRIHWTLYPYTEEI